MSSIEAAGISAEMARAFLVEQVDPAAADVALLDTGAWSRVFGFRLGDEELVVRFGRHGDDFAKDRRAAAYRTPDLPIPAVLAIGPAFGGFYAISTRVRGTPLEELTATEWREVVPSLVAALEALRLADVSATAGYGGWDGEGRTAYHGWPARPQR